MRFRVFLVLALTGCGLSKVDDGCFVGAGIAHSAYDGSDLAAKTLAITFSGGPSAATADIADFLYANAVRAAFFVDGKNAILGTKILAHLKNREHLVANHSFSGKDLTRSVDPIFEVRKTDEIITPYVTGNMFLLRAPDNEFTLKLATTLNDEGLKKYVGPVQWSVGTSQAAAPAGGQTIFKVDVDCWSQGIHPSTCAQGYLEQIRVTERGIVLLHDTDLQTLELLKILVSALKSEGFTMVRVDSVPAVSLALEQTGGEPGLAGGAPGCDDY